MEPKYSPGDFIVVARAFKPKIGDVVVVNDHELGHRILKRIVKIQGKRFFVEGDNRNHSRDSRHFGGVNKKQLRGKVIKKI